MESRITSIYRQTKETFDVRAGIPQGSLLPPIILFYNVDLLEICDRLRTNTSARRIIDVNVLADSTSTEENLQNVGNAGT